MNDSSARKRKDSSQWLEALEWHTALCETPESELTSGTIYAWQQWYAESDNQQVFDDLSQLLANHRDYRQPAEPSDAELENDAYDPSVPIRMWCERQQTRIVGGGAPSFKSRWLKRSVVTLLAVAAGLVAVLMVQPWLIPLGGGRDHIYQTRVGELTEIHLRDGSSVTLGGDTRLVVDYTAKRRTIQLIRGEAWFRDKDISNWPFVVTAADRAITALGTAFIVNRDVDRVVVMVTAGTVEVSSRIRMPRLRAAGLTQLPLQPLHPIRLVRNQELTYSDDGAVGRVTRTNSQVATDWTQGRLAFNDVPLRYVTDNVNRYWSRHIRVSPRAGELRFSGLVYEDQIQDWLAGLSRIFPVVVDNTGADVCIHMRDSTATRHRPACREPQR